MVVEVTVVFKVAVVVVHGYSNFFMVASIVHTNIMKAAYKAVKCYWYISEISKKEQLQ